MFWRLFSGKLSNRQIRKVIDGSDPLDILACSNARIVENVLSRPERRERVRGKPVIELGPSHTRLLPILFEAGISSYTGVEPFKANKTRRVIGRFVEGNPEYKNRVSISELDGLRYLRSVDSESANVVSLGVIDRLVIGNRCDGKLSRRYMSELLEEIYCVTPPRGISIHIGHSPYPREFISLGFEYLGGYARNCFFVKN